MITKVLLIDDDIDEHEIFSLALKKHDSRITFVSVNSLESFFRINFLPDVILLGMNIPQTDGMTCLREIKETIKFQDIPVYIYSTAAYCHREREAFELGALRWITKPKSMSGYSQLFEELFPL
jgi:CheY-like chemotaxis protein